MIDSVLLVDYRGMAYPSGHVYKDLSHNGENTGVVFGMMKTLGLINYLFFSERNSKIKVIFVDDKPPYFRKKFYPEFKMDRVRDKPETINLKQQTDDAKRFLRERLGFSFLEYEGLECDDVVGFICRYGVLKKIYILSSDSDMFSYLSRNDKKIIIRKIEKQWKLFKYTDFVNKYNLKPYQWSQVLCLDGGHNNLPGIKNVGIVRAMDIVKNLGKDTKKEHKNHLSDWHKFHVYPFDQKLFGYRFKRDFKKEIKEKFFLEMDRKSHGFRHIENELRKKGMNMTTENKMFLSDNGLIF